MAYDGTIRFDTRLDASGFEQGASRMGDVAKGMVAFKIIEQGFQLIANSVDRAVARYDTLQRFPRVLELMGFSANDASAATRKLADGVDGLPTALDDVVHRTTADGAYREPRHRYGYDACLKQRVFGER